MAAKQPSANNPDKRGKTASPAAQFKPPRKEGGEGEKKSLVGVVINNNYRIEQFIKAGGMGEVYRGEHVYTGDPVAIKIVLQTLSKDEKVLTLFKREARILSQLADDAIVRYFNFIPDPDLDRYCLIMEFIDGTPLGDLVEDNGPLPLADAQRLITRVARGLDKAHKREVTHRDLSPDNVMLPHGSVDEAVLIDFGIAKSTEMTEGTLHGQLAGKFKYISPEQLGHFEGVISPRTDIYGLALLVAAAVRGKPIDMGSTVVEAVNARRVIPDLSGVYPELKPLLAYMLEPDPQMRPASMLDVAAMVEGKRPVPQKYTGQTHWPQGDDPTIIAGAVPGQPQTHAPGTHGQTDVTTISGLQQPPGAPPITGIGTDLHETSNSPFGGTATAPFSTVPPAELQLPPPEPRKSRVLPIVVVLAALLGGAGVAWQMGLFGTPVEVADPSTPQDGPPQETADAPLMPPPDTSTRQGFLASYPAERTCLFATRVTSGENAGKLEVFGTDPTVLAQLPQAYAAAFRTEPAVVQREILQTQCAALDLSRNLQGRDALEPAITLDTDRITSGGSVAGRIRNVEARTLWLAVVSAAGGVYNLSPRLTAQADGSQTFDFGMSLDAGADRAPQLLLVVASVTPILSLAAIKDGDDVSDVAPLILSEIAGRGGGAAAGLGYFLLDPAVQ